VTIPDDMDSHYKGVHCHECEDYGHIRTECATFLKKQKKSLTVSWSDDESEEEGESESAKHITALSSKNFADVDSCVEDLGFAELSASYKCLTERNNNICKQLEEHRNITSKLENDRISHQAKISELNHKVTLLKSHLSQAMKQVKMVTGEITPTLVNVYCLILRKELL
jgi:chromosome segregation ATPase